MASAVTPHIDLVLKSKGRRLRRFSIFLRNIPYACPLHQGPLYHLWVRGLELPYADIKQDGNLVPTLALTILQAEGVLTIIRIFDKKPCHQRTLQ